MTTAAINQTAALAASIHKKPSRRDAMRHLEALIKGAEIAPDAAAKLYAFFMPAPSKKPKNVFDWVWLAVAVRDVRCYLNYAYSDGEFLHGTDGWRVHRAPTDLAQGFYDAAGNHIESHWRYPDISRVIIPADDQAQLVDVAAYPVEVVGQHTAYRLPSGALVQKAFIDDAVSLGDARLTFLDDVDRVRLDCAGNRVVIIQTLRQ